MRKHRQQRLWGYLLTICAIKDVQTTWCEITPNRSYGLFRHGTNLDLMHKPIFAKLDEISVRLEEQSTSIIDTTSLCSSGYMSCSGRDVRSVANNDSTEVSPQITG